MDNDVMFGKPSSFFSNLALGIAAHQEGKVAPDLYRLQKEPLVNDDGTIRLQIKEIEPEVSALSKVLLWRIPRFSDKRLYVVSNFKDLVSVKINDTANTKVDCRDSSGESVSLYLKPEEDQNAAAEDSLTLETGEYIDIEVQGYKKGQYMLLQSWYRDWTLGDIYGQSVVASSYLENVFLLKSIKKAKLIAVGTIATLFGYIGLGSYGSQNVEDLELLTQSFGSTPRAYADVPTGRSLELSYLDANGVRKKFEVIEPRYARPSTLAVLLPEDVMTSDGIAKVRITATKRHKVSGIAIVNAEQVDVESREKIELMSAVHVRDQKEHKDTLTSKEPEYIITYPSDVIDLTFRVANTGQFEQYDYILSVSGVYAPASYEEQTMVPNWTHKLDTEAKSFLTSVYKSSYQPTV